MSQIVRGELLTEGKTKRVWAVVGEPDMVILESKDDITAGDGAKHDVMAGKAAWSTTTTCNVFRALKHAKLPWIAFVEQIDSTSFKARRCTMHPFEVVVRGEAHGSYLKRHPDVQKGHPFDPLVAEVHLKTEKRKWKGYELPADDPLMLYHLPTDEVRLHHPGQPFNENEPFLTLPRSEILERSNMQELLRHITICSKKAFIITRNAWRPLGGDLVDFKVEWGETDDGDDLMADVIDNDSWRVIIDGEYADKQRYRDGKPLDDVAARYALVAQLTCEFVQ